MFRRAPWSSTAGTYDHYYTLLLLDMVCAFAEQEQGAASGHGEQEASRGVVWCGTASLRGRLVVVVVLDGRELVRRALPKLVVAHIPSYVPPIHFDLQSLELLSKLGKLLRPDGQIAHELPLRVDMHRRQQLDIACLAHLLCLDETYFVKRVLRHGGREL